jgi:hypothetical protein
MVEDNKINMYINSKNRNSNESSSRFRVKVPENLLRLNKNEYFTLNVNGFYCFNSWFNCINDFNNIFEIIIYDMNGNLYQKNEYRIITGHPNVNDILLNLNQLLLSFVVVTYDKVKNKFNFKRVLPITNNNFTMYLNIINSEDFLGFYKTERKKEILLQYLINTMSSNYININGDEAIIIKIAGDCVLEGNTVDNFTNNIFEASNIIFMKPIDTPSCGLLKYDNYDGGDSFQYRLSNYEQINWYELSVYNQDNEHIPQFSDYILLLQFIKHQRKNQLESLLESILDYLKQIYLLISHVLFQPTN